MAIFEFSRPDSYIKVSEEWQVFENVFPDTGAFKYLAGRKKVYIDDNTYRILRIKKSSEDGSMHEKEFFDILNKITAEPVYNKRHIYNYRCGNESFWIKLCMMEKSGEWLGFIKDMTYMMQGDSISESINLINPVTRLKSREAFLEELRVLAETKSIEFGCLAIFHINGINQMNKILGIDNSKKCVSSVSRTVSHFASDNVIIGSTTYFEFLIFFKDRTEEQSIEMMRQIADAVHHSKITDDFGEALIPGSDAYLTLNCGYSVFPNDSQDFNKLVDYSSFALYEIRDNITGLIKKFDVNTYKKEREYYTDTQIFCKIIEDNLFEYHMQPIVSARTGAVYGYEALMRTTGNKYLNPLQMLEIAKKQKRTYDIEKKTFFNVMKISSENSDVFKQKKLFINSIPDHMLNDDDFTEICRLYGNLMDRVVVEITEEADMSENHLKILNRRREKTGIQIAFDDFGTGYSNTANLIRYNPEYIKIDRSLVSGIDKDVKKKHLVKGMIDFAKENNILSLAEGIESSAELSTVINLGVDLIQGYYTSRPKPFILYEISNEVKNEIITVNDAKKNVRHPFYVTENMSVINLDMIDGNAYSEILVRRSNIKITGRNTVFKTGIVIDSGISCEMTIDNINIKRSKRSPVITLKENSSLTLTVEGDNEFHGIGIYTPESTALTINGNGNLKIISDEDNACCIGTTITEEYGNITVDMTGNLTLNVNGINTVAIGGGINSIRNKIDLISGNISVCNTGKRCITFGCTEGNAIVDISSGCNIDIEGSGNDSVAIGCMKGTVSVASTGSIKIIGSGENVVGIGVLKNGMGIIDIRDSNIDINLGAKNTCCIGTNGGNIVTRVENAKLMLAAGGSVITGIGDFTGGGTVSLSNNEITLKLKAEQLNTIGSPLGTVVDSDNQITDNSK